MREFTKEEKELIVNTEITPECFGIREGVPTGIEFKENRWLFPHLLWDRVVKDCEYLRSLYINTKDERIFSELIRLLPNSYKVVKL